MPRRNTWCTDDLCGLIDKCTDSEIRSVADAMVAQGMDKLGYEYVSTQCGVTLRVLRSRSVR